MAWEILSNPGFKHPVRVLHLVKCACMMDCLEQVLRSAGESPLPGCCSLHGAFSDPFAH